MQNDYWSTNVWERVRIDWVMEALHFSFFLNLNSKSQYTKSQNHLPPSSPEDLREITTTAYVVSPPLLLPAFTSTIIFCLFSFCGNKVDTNCCDVNWCPLSQMPGLNANTCPQLLMSTRPIAGSLLPTLAPLTPTFDSLHVSFVSSWLKV